MGRGSAVMVPVLLALVLSVPIAALVAPAEISLAGESGDFSYALIENGTEVEITGFSGTQANVTIPDVIEGRPVTSIGDSAFKNCSSMTNVTVPSTVRNIGSKAFARTGLVEVDIPEGVNSIGDLAFERCYYLSSITLGKNLTTIGMGAFQTCTSLTVITIPENVTTIGPYAFLYCTSLDFFYVAENNPAYKARNDGALYSKDGSELVQFPIGGHISMMVPEGVTSIGEGAFSTALYLGQVTLSKTVASIGPYAFADCPELYSLWFEGDAPTCGEGWVDHHNSALKVYYSPDAEGFTAPEWNGLPSEFKGGADEFPYEIINNGTEVRLIDYNGYGGEVIIPSTIEGLPVTEIGGDAFYFQSMTSIFVPASVRYISDGAFSYIYGIIAIIVDPLNANYVSIDGVLYNENGTILMQCPQGKTGSFVVPESTTHIDSCAFRGCYYLSEVGLPEGLVAIGEYAFEGCSSLTSMKIPESVQVIRWGAFRNCYSLRSVNIPENITTIQSETFKECGSLVSIDIPENVEYIGWDAFAYNNLETVHIAREGVVIGENAFEFCDMLREVSMAPSIIGDYAFFYCNSLTLVSLDDPSGLLQIGDQAFSGCSVLAVLNLSGAMNLQSIGNGTFEGCSALISLDLRAGGLQSIGSYAFWGCESLTEISLPDTVTIGAGAFSFCHSLNKFVIPEMTKVPDDFFYDCYALKSVSLPKNASQIGTGAFAYCTSLSSIIIPSNVSHIGYWAFLGCSNLTDIYFEGDAPQCDGYWEYLNNETMVIHHREGANGFNTTAWENMTVEKWVEDDGTGKGNDGLFLLTIVALAAVGTIAGVFLVTRRRKR